MPGVGVTHLHRGASSTADIIDQKLTTKTVFFLCTLILILVVAACCGSNCSVSGKVTFPDGTPMTTGEVVFETPAIMARGKIQNDGTYSLSSGELKGVPKVSYQVCISGFAPKIEMASPSTDGRPSGPPKVTPPVIPVAKKFLSPATFGLTCEVKGSTKYNITVEPPQ